MSEISDYVAAHTDRGECSCGRCFDRGEKPDPTGHCADMVFFKVVARGAPTADEFRRLSIVSQGVHGTCNPVDGAEHNYLELGGWIGDQGLALQYMALGALLGVFTLLTPRTLFGDTIPDDLIQQMAGQGFVAVFAKAA